MFNALIGSLLCKIADPFSNTLVFVDSFSPGSFTGGSELLPLQEKRNTRDISNLRKRSSGFAGIIVDYLGLKNLPCKTLFNKTPVIV
jgi:hypothetical protein